MAQSVQSPKRPSHKVVRPDSVSSLLQPKIEVATGSVGALPDKNRAVQAVKSGFLPGTAKMDGPSAILISETQPRKPITKPTPPSSLPPSSAIIPSVSSVQQAPGARPTAVGSMTPALSSSPATPAAAPAANPSTTTSNNTPSSSGFSLPEIVTSTANMIRRTSNPFLLLSARRGSREVIPVDAVAAIAASVQSSSIVPSSNGAGSSISSSAPSNAVKPAGAVGTSGSTSAASGGAKQQPAPVSSTSAPNTNVATTSVVASTPAPAPAQSTLSMLLSGARRASSRQVVPIDDNGNQSSDSPETKHVPTSSNRRGSSSIASIAPSRGTEKETEKDKSKAKVLCCDKCDGKHETEDCPHYKKSREAHPDAQKMLQKIGGTSNLPGAFLSTATIVRQPGDGSCLFHSMSYGLKDGSNASSLRSEICSFINRNPQTKISDTPLQDWVKWDTGTSVSDYSRKMASPSAWGGGIEMACVSQLKNVNVHVYEVIRGGGASIKGASGVRGSVAGYKRISAFDCAVDPERRPTVRVLYCGGVHYEALVATV